MTNLEKVFLLGALAEREVAHGRLEFFPSLSTPFWMHVLLDDLPKLDEDQYEAEAFSYLASKQGFNHLVKFMANHEVDDCIDIDGDTVTFTENGVKRTYNYLTGKEI